MRVGRRGVSPVISVILMVAIVVILAAVLSVPVLDFAEDLNDPAPNMGTTTGEFEPELDYPDNQIVRIIHTGGEGVALDKLEMVVRASGDSTDKQVRLVNLPPDLSTFDDDSYEGNDGLVSGQGVSDGVLFDGSSTWAAGQSIKFRIPTGEADFRGEDPDADELKVIIVHTRSNAIIAEHTFRP